MFCPELPGEREVKTCRKRSGVYELLINGIADPERGILKDGKFGTCLNCMDGRVQLPVIQWIQKEYGLDYIDMITEAGMDGLLARDDVDITNIIEKINISLDKHNSGMIFIVGHFDCAGNAVEKGIHKEHINAAVNKVRSLFSKCEVVGIWVSDEWEAERIYE